MPLTRRTVLAGGALLAAWGTSTAQAAEASLPKDAVIILAEVKAKPGKEDALKKACLAMVKPTRKEKGCICYNFHQSKEDKGRFMFYEQWADTASIESHKVSKHMKAFQAKSEGLVEKLDIALFDMLGE